MCDKSQLNSIRVRWSAGAGKWNIVTGQRRWQTTGRAELATVACYSPGSRRTIHSAHVILERC